MSTNLLSFSLVHPWAASCEAEWRWDSGAVALGCLQRRRRRAGEAVEAALKRWQRERDFRSRVFTRRLHDRYFSLVRWTSYQGALLIIGWWKCSCIVIQQKSMGIVVHSRMEIFGLWRAARGARVYSLLSLEASKF